MKFVQVNNGLVVNISSDENRDTAPEGWHHHDTAQIGWTFTNGSFFPPQSQGPTPEEIRSDRIAELKFLLSTTDYKVLPDYDKDASDIKVYRQLWRDEIRSLDQGGS